MNIIAFKNLKTKGDRDDTDPPTENDDLIWVLFI